MQKLKLEFSTEVATIFCPWKIKREKKVLVQELNLFGYCLVDQPRQAHRFIGFLVGIFILNP